MSECQPDLLPDQDRGEPGRLRSAFTPGTTRWAVRRAQWRPWDPLADEDIDKPKIAIVNTSSQLSVCFPPPRRHRRRVSSEAVREAGGTSFRDRTAAPSDFVTSAGRKGRYLMPTPRPDGQRHRDRRSKAPQLDGMVCLSSCDKTPPGH